MDGAFGETPLAFLSGESSGETRDRFARSNSRCVIESLVLGDNRSVLEFLGDRPAPEDIGRLASQGILRE
jgi:hypothetical protein